MVHQVYSMNEENEKDIALKFRCFNEITRLMPMGMATDEDFIYAICMSKKLYEFINSATKTKEATTD